MKPYNFSPRDDIDLSAGCHARQSRVSTTKTPIPCAPLMLIIKPQIIYIFVVIRLTIATRPRWFHIFKPTVCIFSPRIQFVESINQAIQFITHRIIVVRILRWATLTVPLVGLLSVETDVVSAANRIITTRRAIRKVVRSVCAPTLPTVVVVSSHEYTDESTNLLRTFSLTAICSVFAAIEKCSGALRRVGGNNSFKLCAGSSRRATR